MCSAHLRSLEQCVVHSKYFVSFSGSYSPIDAASSPLQDTPFVFFLYLFFLHYQIRFLHLCHTTATFSFSVLYPLFFYLVLPLYSMDCGLCPFVFCFIHFLVPLLGVCIWLLYSIYRNSSYCYCYFYSHYYRSVFANRVLVSCASRRLVDSGRGFLEFAVNTFTA